MLARDLQGGQPVLRLQDPVPALLEDFAGEGAQGGLVLDDQDRRIATRGLAAAARPARGRRSVYGRQEHGEGGAAVADGVDGDVAAASA